ncbi:MAG: hypothetical protein AUH79_04140 [Betaproteobacteria bacterium 13_1_40CM_4_64_4]|nr:MAG: hypothetical protein AUH79_04140 [Betaproteobacteria bacterium 13_1_40CM_4_64_4]
MNATTTGEAATRHPLPRETAKILGDCRDLAIHRLLLSFTSMLDRVGDLLILRAEKSDVRDEQALCLDARGVLMSERANLMAEFERNLRLLVDRRMKGEEPKTDFSTLDARKLTLVDTTAMDESVISGNIVRVVENLCYDELHELNRAVGYLLGRPELETAGNPLAPTTIVEAFTEALRSIKGDPRIKFTILKELNQSSLGDINAIYADLNRHLENLHVVPQLRPSIHRPGGPHGDRASGGDGKDRTAAHEAAAGEIDMMAMLQRLASHGFGLTRLRSPAMPGGLPPGGIQVPAAGPAPQGMAGMAMPPGMTAGMPAGAGEGMEAPLPAIGQFGGPRILVTQELGDALSRLQQGETGFDVGGIPVQFAGIPQGMHNVLRDLQESPIGAKANQLEAMTIELVAMLFDFVFETKDLPDSMKVLVGRLQIPVLKAAMLDGAFFSKKSHPSRLFVNALAHAGIGWSPAMGLDDPLYKKVDQLVHRVLDEFTDDISLFDELRKDLEAFLAEEEKSAEATIQTTAEEINQRDRQEIARVVSRSELEKRLETHTVPNFLGGFLRDNWITTLEQLHLQGGEESEAWASALATLDDLVWSVQPKRTSEERKKLVAMLPNLLKRLHGGLQNVGWEAGERERFMGNLVEAHAAAVKPSLASMPMPTTAVAEAAAAAAEEANAKGDVETATKARALAEAMAPAPPPAPEPMIEVVQDHFAELAATLERGMWIEFEGEGGQLAFAKLAWVSPLRGTYLFTNRQGQKAVSLTADELADRFRNDRARLVEAEPLVDRAFVSMMASLEERFGEQPA